MTDKRGNAWHYRAADQGGESNHYPGAIPVADVQRRLFDWEPEPCAVAIEKSATFDTMDHLNAEGLPARWVVQANRLAVAPSDSDVALGMFKSGYKVHPYKPWLLDNVATILDDDLCITSAGLLKDRAVAWVEVGVPESVTTPEGVTFRPNLLMCTSIDGSLATTGKRTITMTVCDNTMFAALGEDGPTIKFKHTSQSLGKIGAVREALGIVYSTADAFAVEVARLTARKVTPVQFKSVVAQLVPVTDAMTDRQKNTADRTRSELGKLYNLDPRCEPWKGTAFGVVQTFNTWNHHLQNGLGGKTDAQKQVARGERNSLRALNGETEKSDALVLRALESVLS
jgi:phage/plasmid-like protein (TIGR03299 family)